MARLRTRRRRVCRHKRFSGRFWTRRADRLRRTRSQGIRSGRIDEALKLERAMSQLRTAKRVVVLHYAPIGDTIRERRRKSIPTWAARVLQK